jgi:uncharacterized protein (DUF427 family)
MIYFFGTGDSIKVVFGGKNLTESEKSQASLVLESLPPTSTPAGKAAKFYIDPTTKQFEYKYVDKVVLTETPLLSTTYESLTTTELKTLCKERGITGYSSLTKEELIAELEEYDANQNA